MSSILFHRLFGPVVPQTREALGVTYPCVASEEVDSLIEEKISQFMRRSENGGQIGVQFFEKRAKKPSWFGKTSEDVCWEQWVIDVTIDDEKDKEKSRLKTEKQLREILFSILSVVNNNKDHIPPITTTDATPFPYQIVVPSDNGEETWGSVIKKMLVEQ